MSLSIVTTFCRVLNRNEYFTVQCQNVSVLSQINVKNLPV